MNYYELYHHGVKGQKWGVRRYQDKHGRLTAAGKAHLKGIDDPFAGNQYGDIFKDMKRYGKSSADAPSDMVADAQAVNGGVRGYVMGFNRNWNCAFCATAYELRRRGEDVHSQESLQGVSSEATKIPYMNIKKSDIRTDASRKSGKTMHIGMTQDEFGEMQDTIMKDGNNSRGRINVQWKAPAEGYGPMGGHALNYEVKNGKFYLVDSQVGKVLSGKDAYNYMSSAINVEHFRTDNKKVNARVSEKYFVEKNADVRINTDKELAYKKVNTSRKVDAISEVTAAASIGVISAGSAAPGGTAAGVAGLTLSVVASGAARSRANKQIRKATEAQSKASLELEKKWEKENRWKVYDEGKVKGRGK